MEFNKVGTRKSKIIVIKIGNILLRWFDSFEELKFKKELKIVVLNHQNEIAKNI